MWEPEEEREDGESFVDVQRERDLLRALIDSTPHFFVVIDAEGKTRLMNPAMLEALGYREEEVLGADYLQTIVLYEDREELKTVFERIVKGRQRTLNENHVLTKEGQSLLVQWHGTPMYDENGDIAYFFGVGTDITERRHRDLLIAEREARYREVFAHARDPMIFSDAEGRILDANDAAERCLGFRRWELRRTRIAEIGLPEPHDEPTRITLAHRNGHGFTVEVVTSRFEVAEEVQMLHVLIPAREAAPDEEE